MKGDTIVEVCQKRRPATYSGIGTPAFVGLQEKKRISVIECSKGEKGSVNSFCLVV